MKKKLLSIFIPIIMVAVVALGVVLPTSLADRKEAVNNTATYAEDTGASTAEKSKKGGAIFLAEGVSYTMKGGKIEGKKKKYGGAVYVSKDATFTLDGGTITNCQAKYGGAIYVANGGHCIIKSGTVNLNKSESGPAIYVETGGDLQVIEGDIDNNLQEDWPKVATVSEDTIKLGGVNSSVELHYLTLGSYPQTYVGDTLRQTLEDEYAKENHGTLEDMGVTYNSGKDNDWIAYKYNGTIYVRGTEQKYDNNSLYQDGTSPITDRVSWFEVEPIKWYVLNYEEYLEGKPLELLSTTILASKVRFNPNINMSNDWETSEIRQWCNSNFYDFAFKKDEKEEILATILKNNKKGEHNKDPNIEGNWTGNNTTDKIYLLSYWDMYNTDGLFQGRTTMCLASGSDFSIGNNLRCVGGTSCQTIFGKNAECWLRTTGDQNASVYYITIAGHLSTSPYNMTGDCCGIRPALRLSL